MLCSIPKHRIRSYLPIAVVYQLGVLLAFHPADVVFSLYCDQPVPKNSLEKLHGQFTENMNSENSLYQLEADYYNFHKIL